MDLVKKNLPIVFCQAKLFLKEHKNDQSTTMQPPGKGKS